MKTLARARYDFTVRYLKKVLIEANGSVARAAEIAGRDRTDMYKVLHRYGFHCISHKGMWDRPVPGE